MVDLDTVLLHALGACIVAMVGLVVGLLLSLRTRNDTANRNEYLVHIDVDLTGIRPLYDEFFVKKGVEITEEMEEHIRQIHNTGAPYPKGIRPRLVGAIYNW